MRWPIYLLAAIITALFVLAMAGVLRLSQTGPVKSPAPAPALEGLIRPEMPEFERLSEKIILEQLTAVEAPLNDLTIEVSATVRNTTDRTVSGLEMRGAVLDAQRSPLRERTVVVVPDRQTALEPGEAISVRVLLEGIHPEAERAGAMMEVTGVRVD